MDLMLTNMDQISSKLTTIAEKDYSEQLTALEKASAVTAYRTERIDKELAYINRMNYYAGKYDDVGIFKSIPPTW